MKVSKLLRLAAQAGCTITERLNMTIIARGTDGVIVWPDRTVTRGGRSLLPLPQRMQVKQAAQFLELER